MYGILTKDNWPDLMTAQIMCGMWGSIGKTTKKIHMPSGKINGINGCAGKSSEEVETDLDGFGCTSLWLFGNMEEKK